MKASADEKHLQDSWKIFSTSMHDNDVGIFISGRNKFIHKDLLKEARSMKPKMAIKERVMEPDEDMFLKHVRIDRSYYFYLVFDRAELLFILLIAYHTHIQDGLY